MQQYEYDVALSFAGEDRLHAEELANLLESNGYNVFYDKYERASLWGKDLYTHLSSIYKDKARYCVMFLSKHYAQKLWPNHERQNAQARAFEESREYILPVRLDDTEIPGILPTVGYLDLREMNISQICQSLEEKLSDTPSPTTTDRSITTTNENDPTEFVLLYLENGQQYFIPVQNAHWNSTEIVLDLIPELPEETVFLCSLRDSIRNPFVQRNKLAFALQENAAWVSPKDISQITSDSQTVWRIILTEDSNEQNSLFNEVRVNNILPDQIAERRARRILLDEKLREPGLESFIAGGFLSQYNNIIEVSKSPIPDLYRSLRQMPEKFQKFARLISVIYLQLSNTVEDILLLDLKFLSSQQLQVRFKGRRHQRYQNAEPSVIEVNGICPL